MNEQQPEATPPAKPTPPIPEPPARTGLAADRVREDFRAFESQPGLLSVTETLLRHPGRILYEIRNGRWKLITGLLAGVAALCLVAYGITAGMFSWGSQLWASPLKITLGMFLSALICLPSLVIFSCLSGSETRMEHILALLAGMVAMTALLLLGFAPVAWIFSQSTESIGFMGALHLAFWGIGMYYGLRFLLGATRFLEGRRVQHMVVWSIIFILVSLQMTTTLRPLIGTSDRFLQAEKKFFLAHWCDSFWEDPVELE